MEAFKKNFLERLDQVIRAADENTASHSFGQRGHNAMKRAVAVTLRRNRSAAAYQNSHRKYQGATKRHL